MSSTTFDFDLLPQPWRRRLPSISTSFLRYGIEGLRCSRQRDSMLAAKGFDARVVKPLKSLARPIFDGMQFGIVTRRTLGNDGELKDINESFLGDDEGDDVGLGEVEAAAEVHHGVDVAMASGELSGSFSKDGRHPAVKASVLQARIAIAANIRANTYKMYRLRQKRS